MFLRAKFICIIWTIRWLIDVYYRFLRAKFICIIWTKALKELLTAGSWGLSLFVLFELNFLLPGKENSSWGLSLFVLFELNEAEWKIELVLEG